MQNIVGTFISPFSPALWLAIGLAGLEMEKHIRIPFSGYGESVLYYSSFVFSSV